MTQIQTNKKNLLASNTQHLFGAFEHSRFEFVSDFEIRISNLGMPILRIIPYRFTTKPAPAAPGSLLEPKKIFIAS